jgi:hypothetical protein
VSHQPVLEACALLLHYYTSNLHVYTYSSCLNVYVHTYALILLTYICKLLLYSSFTCVSPYISYIYIDVRILYSQSKAYVDIYDTLVITFSGLVETVVLAWV